MVHRGQITINYHGVSHLTKHGRPWSNNRQLPWSQEHQLPWYVQFNKTWSHNYRSITMSEYLVQPWLGRQSHNKVQSWLDMQISLPEVHGFYVLNQL